MYSQDFCDTLPFIHYDKNVLVLNNNDQIDGFINKLKPDKPEKVQIIHIGDSHLQAGFLSEKIKQKLFKRFNIDTIASPGFVFPYTIAQTNNPYSFKVKYSGEWQWCKNVDSEKSCKLGLSGITVRTKDSLASLQFVMDNIKYNDPVKYYFDRVKIFHSSKPFELSINGKKVILGNGFSSVEFDSMSDSLMIEIKNSDPDQYFELYGIILENSESKINYHSIGVNGATAQSYLKCDYFSKHIKEIDPDAIILSLGSNEAYDAELTSLEHEYVLRDLILQIKDTAPNSTIILTSPNDHFKNGEPNKKVAEVRKNIIKISNEFNLPFWDLYSIMGGEGSIEKWYDKNLTGEDKIHFKKLGYELQGELFVHALMQIIQEY